MKKSKFEVISLQFLLFVVLLVYFTKISPVMPFDGDDWRYVGGVRQPWPLWGVWNPSKVLPEVLMPLGGYLAAFIVYPFSHNYVWSITFVEALILSAFAVLMFYRFLIKRLNASKRVALISEALFFLSFFILFKHLGASSYTGFWAVDLTCDFNYLIPGFVNASFLFFLLQFDNFQKAFFDFDYLHKGLIVLAAYFVIFSSGQENIIVVGLCLAELLTGAIRWIYSKDFSAIKDRILYLIFLIAWLISVFFDLHGQRAQEVSSVNKGTYVHRIGATLNSFASLMLQQNFAVVFFFILVIFSSIVLALYRHQREHKKRDVTFGRLFFLELLSLIICFAYLIVAYAKAGSSYASRPDAMWSCIFTFLLLSNTCGTYLMMQLSFIKVFLPLLAILETFIAFNFNYRPIYPNNVQYDAQTVCNVDNFIIKQIVRADKAGKTEVKVRVPLDQKSASASNPASNWPHSYDMAKWLQDTLYAHHIIRTRMHIIFEPDSKVNKMFYENTSKQQPVIPIE